MHFMLNADHIRKLANIKNIQSSIFKEHLGISEGRSFTSMSEVEKREAGSCLSGLLKEVSGGSLVPILNSALDVEEVKQLSSLRGVLDNVSSADDVKKEEPEDVDELMAAAIDDIPKWKRDRASASGGEETDIESMKAELNRLQIRLKKVEENHEQGEEKGTEVSSNNNKLPCSFTKSAYLLLGGKHVENHQRNQGCEQKSTTFLTLIIQS